MDANEIVIAKRVSARLGEKEPSGGDGGGDNGGGSGADASRIRRASASRVRGRGECAGHPALVSRRSVRVPFAVARTRALA